MDREQIHELDDIWESQRTFHDALFPNLSSRLVPGEGSIDPLAMVIGEAPGAQEDMALRPFVGPSGRVLTGLMATAGLYRGEVGSSSANAWVSNIVKFRPPKNRTPTPEEINHSTPFLKAEWNALGRPRIIIAVGGTAVQAITGKKSSILKVAGQCYRYTSNTDGGDMYVWPMVHPRFGLSQPQVRPLLERDWERLGDWLAIHQHRAH